MRSMLKIFLTLNFLFFISIYSYAQSPIAELDSPNKIERSNQEKAKLVKDAESRQKLYWNHTELATSQFVNYLDQAITYTQHLESQYAEGALILEVTIEKDGRIQSAKVIKNGHPDLDKVAIAAILQMERINLDGLPYHGARHLRIPVNFSLR